MRDYSQTEQTVRDHCHTVLDLMRDFYQTEIETMRDCCHTERVLMRDRCQIELELLIDCMEDFYSAREHLEIVGFCFGFMFSDLCLVDLSMFLTMYVWFHSRPWTWIWAWIGWILADFTH